MKQKSYEDFATNEYCECSHCVLEHSEEGCRYCLCKKTGEELYEEYQTEDKATQESISLGEHR